MERAREAIEDAMSGSAAMAQVKATLSVAEATLALVEQQRLANLIALGQFRNVSEGFPPLRHLVLEAVDEFSVQPVSVLRDGLGLS